MIGFFGNELVNVLSCAGKVKMEKTSWTGTSVF
jgi:hypothetical protein